MGDTATTMEDGNTLTVFSYESPLPPTNSPRPGPDSEFSAIEVEGCASSSSGRDLMYVGSPAFVLQMPDGDRILPVKEAQETGVKEAVLETMDPVPANANVALSSFRRRGARGRSSWSSRSSSRPKGRCNLSDGQSRMNKTRVRNKPPGSVPMPGNRGAEPNF